MIISTFTPVFPSATYIGTIQILHKQLGWVVEVSKFLNFAQKHWKLEEKVGGALKTGPKQLCTLAHLECVCAAGTSWFHKNEWKWPANVFLLHLSFNAIFLFSSDMWTFMDGLLQISPMEMLTNTIALNSMETNRNGCFIAIWQLQEALVPVLLWMTLPCGF